jgi:modulator of FtsH protease
MAFMAQQMRVGYPNVFVVLIGFYGLFFLTNKLRDSAWGLVSAFALTGFMGFILGPILNRYLGMAGGAEVVSSAFAMTALVFGGLSAYVLITRKDMSFLGGFITAGFFVLLGGSGRWHVLPDQRSAVGDQRRLCAVLLRVHPVPDQRHHPRR